MILLIGEIIEFLPARKSKKSRLKKNYKMKYFSGLEITLCGSDLEEPGSLCWTGLYWQNNNPKVDFVLSDIKPSRGYSRDYFLRAA